jgi:hypothetical protein
MDDDPINAARAPAPKQATSPSLYRAMSAHSSADACSDNDDPSNPSSAQQIGAHDGADCIFCFQTLTSLKFATPTGHVINPKMG